MACVGVDEEGFREVLAVEEAGSEKGAAYAPSLPELIDRCLPGVRLIVSDGHEGIKAAGAGELPGAKWQRCVVVHFQRNVLSSVPASSTEKGVEDLKATFFPECPRYPRRPSRLGPFEPYLLGRWQQRCRNALQF